MKRLGRLWQRAETGLRRLGMPDSLPRAAPLPLPGIRRPLRGGAASRTAGSPAAQPKPIHAHAMESGRCRLGQGSLVEPCHAQSSLAFKTAMLYVACSLHAVFSVAYAGHRTRIKRRVLAGWRGRGAREPDRPVLIAPYQSHTLCCLRLWLCRPGGNWLLAGAGRS